MDCVSHAKYLISGEEGDSWKNIQFCHIWYVTFTEVLSSYISSLKLLESTTIQCISCIIGLTATLANRVLTWLTRNVQISQEIKGSQNISHKKNLHVIFFLPLTFSHIEWFRPKKGALLWCFSFHCCYSKLSSINLR